MIIVLKLAETHTYLNKSLGARLHLDWMHLLLPSSLSHAVPGEEPGNKATLGLDAPAPPQLFVACCTWGRAWKQGYTWIAPPQLFVACCTWGRAWKQGYTWIAPPQLFVACCTWGRAWEQGYTWIAPPQLFVACCTWGRAWEQGYTWIGCTCSSPALCCMLYLGKSLETRLHLDCSSPALCRMLYLGKSLGTRLHLDWMHMLLPSSLLHAVPGEEPGNKIMHAWVLCKVPNHLKEVYSCVYWYLLECSTPVWVVNMFELHEFIPKIG